MRASVSKSQVKGRVIAPPSKSYTIRGLVCAALTRGESEIVRPLVADDTEAARRVLRGLGAGVREEKDAWFVSGGQLHAPEGDLFCGESAATLRFLTAVCATIPGESRLTAGPSLSRRPVAPLIQALRQLGVDCSSSSGFPPVKVRGGRLAGGRVELPGDVSSQFVSALLLIAPRAGVGMTIDLTTPLRSRPYVLMTLDCLMQFGVSVAFNEALDHFEVLPQPYEPARYVVEGDWSSVSYFLALGALSGGVEVLSLDPRSLQADKALLDLLRQMGADVEVKTDSVVVRESRLRGISADLADCIDLLPAVAVLCALAEGRSELSGIGRARLKESDRVAAVSEGLRRMGIEVAAEADRITITGATPRGAVIASRGDHRIAMAFSILGAIVGDTMIEDAECVAKTYPNFWEILASIGGEVKMYG